MSRSKQPKFGEADVVRETRNRFEEKKRSAVQERKYDRIKRNDASTAYSLKNTVYNKPIFPRTSIFIDALGNERVVARKTRYGKEPTYASFDIGERYSPRSNRTLKKNIQYVRMWFQYLKLALEVEEKYLKIAKSDSYLKVDKAFYRNWHIDKIKSMNFDDWWCGHKDLFTLKPVEIVSGDHSVRKDSILISVPRASNMASVKREIAHLLKNELHGDSTEVNFSDSKTPYISLHIDYNLLVLAYNEVPRAIIRNLINAKYEHIDVAKSKKPAKRSSLWDKISEEQRIKEDEIFSNVFSNENAISRKLKFAKERIERVCVGVFP